MNVAPAPGDAALHEQGLHRGAYLTRLPKARPADIGDHALEIGIVLRKHYQLTIAANDERTRDHFRSISTLAALVASQREAVHAVNETTKKGD